MPHFDYRIVSDGGSRRNGSADSHGYGSFQLMTKAGQAFIDRLDFGKGITNNLAEYMAMLAAFQNLINRIITAGKNPSSYSVIAYTDSQLLVSQMTGQARVKAPHIKRVQAQLAGRCARFDQVVWAKAPRDKIVAILGH